MDFRHLKRHGLTWDSYLIIFKTALQETPAPPFQPVFGFNSASPPPIKDNPVNMFDEDCFRETLRKITNTKSQIMQIVQSVQSFKKVTHKIVRSLKWIIIESQGEHRLAIFHLIHELSLLSSRKKLIDLNQRLGKMICELITSKGEIVPMSRIRKCSLIWKTSEVFTYEVLNKIDEAAIEVIDLSTAESQRERTVADCSSDLNIIMETLDEKLRRFNKKVTRVTKDTSKDIPTFLDLSTEIISDSESSLECSASDCQGGIDGTRISIDERLKSDFGICDASDESETLNI